MIGLTFILLLICTGLLVSLHVRLSRWHEPPLEGHGVFVQKARHGQGEALPQISIHLLNPIEVAEQESSIGRFLGKLSPALISRQVYLKTAESIGHEFRRRGIRARIEILHKESDRTGS